ncbi:hypothetical protein E8E12_004983 [Didymella heteroderae]|uniref:Uncharacterized protein n=1 Tax=Didymella heteroderae TaxID=1769908 RepID=A0A9P4WLH2_9PLEO|nr:hypothetical protein E8E12_004983 [Didymella heteroderae]
MRAPSWSWASIDAPVHTPSWNSREGIGEPWRTTRLSEVINASVDLSTEDVFGQVRSGLITLQGRLSIVVIGQSSYEISQMQTTRGILADTTIHIRAYFDTIEARSSFVERDTSHETIVRRFSSFPGDSLSLADLGFKAIFLLPIRLMQQDKEFTLSGLLLLPTAQERGQYSRAGTFSHYDRDQYPASGGGFLSSSTDIVDERFFISKEGSGDSTEYTISIV